MFSENPRHSSESNEHYTPPYIVDAARKTLGVIDLDPSSDEEINSWSVKAKKIYDIKSNGMGFDWEGTVFLNPPGGTCDSIGNTIYSVNKKWSCERNSKCCHDHTGPRSSQKSWWQKLAHQWRINKVSSAIFIGFSVEILQTTQVDNTGLLPLDFPMCFPSRRLAYYKKVESIDGGINYAESSSPPHSSVIVFLPKKNNLDISVYDKSISCFHSQFNKIGKVLIPRNW